VGCGLGLAESGRAGSRAAEVDSGVLRATGSAFISCGPGPHPRRAPRGPHPRGLPALPLLAPVFSSIRLLVLAVCRKTKPQNAYPSG
jgi:hypothetical protein